MRIVLSGDHQCIFWGSGAVLELEVRSQPGTRASEHPFGTVDPTPGLTIFFFGFPDRGGGGVQFRWTKLGTAKPYTTTTAARERHDAIFEYSAYVWGCPAAACVPRMVRYPWFLECDAVPGRESLK